MYGKLWSSYQDLRISGNLRKPSFKVSKDFVFLKKYSNESGTYYEGLPKRDPVTLPGRSPPVKVSERKGRKGLMRSAKSMMSIAGSALAQRRRTQVSDCLNSAASCGGVDCSSHKVSLNVDLNNNNDSYSSCRRVNCNCRVLCSLGQCQDDDNAHYWVNVLQTPVAHCWSDPSHFKRKFCHVCRKRLDDHIAYKCESK